MPSADPALFWLRFHGEASACPACGSPRITLLDAFSIPRDARGRRVSFVTGCRACGLLFANPLPPPEQLQSFYGEQGAWAASNKAWVKRLERARRRSREPKRPQNPQRPRRPRELLLDALAPYVPIHEPPNGATVLDFGCGDGKFLDRLQDRGWHTYGVEPSVDVAFLRHSRLDVLPQDGRFDFVLLHHVLEHVIDPLGLLRELAGATRLGGVLFVSVPWLDTLPQHRDFRYCINTRNHLLCFSETCLRGLLARAGFGTVARIESRALDEALTNGKPLRLRLIAERTATVPPLSARPLEPAIAALASYARTRGGFGMRMLPVRVRAALIDRARER